MPGGSQACPTWGHHSASNKVYVGKVPCASLLGDLTETRVFSCKFRKKGRQRHSAIPQIRMFTVDTVSSDPPSVG